MATKSTNLQEFDRLYKLQKLSASLLQARTISDVSSVIVRKGFDALNANSGDVVILSREKKVFEVLTYKGYEKKIISSLRNLPKNEPLLTKYVLSRRKPYFIEDISKLDNKFVFAKNFLLSTKSYSAALLPLRVTKKTVGVLQFTFGYKNNFSQEDKSFMLNLADQCAHALDRVIALENEKKTKNELNAIIKSVDDGIIVRNNKDEISFVNTAALAIHDAIKPEELLHLSLREYHLLFSKILDEKGNTVAFSQAPFLEAVAKKKRLKRIFFVVTKKNNKGRWVKVTSIPIVGKNKKTEVVVSVLNDITEEKQRENSKDEFFSIASHELKTPVTSLKAYTQLLEKRFRIIGDDQTASVLQKMDIQIDKLTHLIHDLLDITKIESGRMHISSELFECNGLLAEVVEQVQVTDRGHKIVFEKSGDVVLFADRERIAQVLVNFLTNAMKYSPEGQEVIVKVKKSKGEVIISVKDFGIGITEEGQKHVFERYFRERNFQENTFPGLGLGLYIASQIIRRHGGSIGVKSKKNEGSTFFFSLPRYQK